MRLSEILNESIRFKAWYRPSDGREIILGGFDTHIETSLNNPDLPNNMREAIKSGWVRCGVEFNSRMFIPIGFVQANTLDDAKKTLKWMSDIGRFADCAEVEVDIDGEFRKFNVRNGRIII
jgi:hypothetical protein